MKKALVTALLGSVAMLACAQGNAPAESTATPAAAAQTAAASDAGPAAGSADERAIRAIRQLSPDIKVEHIGPAAMPGFREVIVAGQTLYVSDDGNYLIQGSLFDMRGKKDLSQAAMANFRKAQLAQVPASERIVFAPANPRHTVTVFTDAECGYCRRMHGDIAEYNRLGIAFEYLAFPRMGPASADFKVMESIWCAGNRNKALTDAKNGRNPPATRCTNPVMAHWTLGQRVGLQGTPMIIAENGMAAPGYLPPAQLKQWLDANAAGR